MLHSLRHIDGNQKLIEPYRIVIHGGIDGFSRLVVYLRASTNNRANTVFSYFQEATAKYNVPSRVRSDLGMENYEVGRFMLETRGLNRGSVITGSSVHNQRIERLWRDVNRIVISRFLNIFLYLETREVLQPLNEVHLFCLHFVYGCLAGVGEHSLKLGFYSISTQCTAARWHFITASHSSDRCSRVATHLCCMGCAASTCRLAVCDKLSYAEEPCSTAEEVKDKRL